MSSDLQSLLAAIVADPSDDIARFVYADCLQEHGNSARAEFIRLQVEAERHHPHSNTRADLEQRAYTLFAAHWGEWWGEVCTAVGLGAEAKRYSILPGGARIGEPIPSAEWLDILFDEPAESGEKLTLPEITFRRGFPEAVTFFPFAPENTAANSHLAQWHQVSPLVELVAAHGWVEGRQFGWLDGSFQRSVTTLTAEHFGAEMLAPVLRSPNLENVERAIVRFGASPQRARFSELRHVLAASFAPRLKHLVVPFWNDVGAAALGSPDVLPRLESLNVTLNGNSVTALARGTGLARLRHLAIHGWSSSADLNAACREPVWAQLRSLHLGYGRWETSLHALAAADGLRELEECQLAGLTFTPEIVRDLVRAPLLKRVKHFALVDGVYHDGRALLPLVDIVDPARIETFAVRMRYFPERAANALRAKFGDRVRFLSTD
ncbi:unnamed protein product [Gemmata massiliana]|uniref:Repeat-companion domain protein n=1 Tax=Gemmata massiliana TaxID=1210884 RepID=A0A6P2CRS8_9BACT|nr:TIGR02996 domain-containing protein [Gemmata massiliana]VTR91036.1 unnamed protein product [Gemmata massiliana]